MNEAVLLEGHRTGCICGTAFKKHCNNKHCRWLRCRRDKCSGTYDMRKQRFWCKTKDIPG